MPLLWNITYYSNRGDFGGYSVVAAMGSQYSPPDSIIPESYRVTTILFYLPVATECCACRIFFVFTTFSRLNEPAVGLFTVYPPTGGKSVHLPESFAKAISRHEVTSQRLSGYSSAYFSRQGLSLAFGKDGETSPTYGLSFSGFIFTSKL